MICDYCYVDKEALVEWPGKKDSQLGNMFVRGITRNIRVCRGCAFSFTKVLNYVLVQRENYSMLERTSELVKLRQWARDAAATDPAVRQRLEEIEYRDQEEIEMGEEVEEVLEKEGEWTDGELVIPTSLKNGALNTEEAPKVKKKSRTA